MIFDELWRKEWKRDKLQRFYDKGVKRLQKKNQYREADEWESEAAHFVGEANEELSFLRSLKLTKRARKLQIPLPDYSDKQAWDQSWSRYILTPKGYEALRGAIRKEEAERLKHGMRLWREVLIPIITLLIGIIGTYLAMRQHH
jgi:hypothetical protein